MPKKQPPLPPKPWPKLSEDLKGQRHPDCCQSCGKNEKANDFDGVLTYWIEHDEDDKPTRVLVFLCPRCSKKLIEPHPRLYAQQERLQSHPGKEQICIDCKHRDGLTCTQAQFNGGPGVHLIMPTPIRVHLCGSPRRLSGWVTMWRGPVQACDRHQTVTQLAMVE